MSKRLKPIGDIPRLLGAWVCTEAVRAQSRERGGGGGARELLRPERSAELQKSSQGRHVRDPVR